MSRTILLLACRRCRQLMPEADFRPVLDLVCSECAASILVGPRPIDIRAATLTRQRNALAKACRELVDAGERILSLDDSGSLAACAYQGPPPKKWAREVAPALDARAATVQKVQAMIKDSVIQARAALAEVEANP